MPSARSFVALLAALASLASLPACGSDDAVKRDAEDVRREVDKGAGTVDEQVKDAAKEAGRAIEKGVEDVDGR